MAQLVKRPTLDFSSGHDLTVHEFKSHTPHQADSTDRAEPAWDPLSLSLLPPLSLSKTNTHLKKKGPP